MSSRTTFDLCRNASAMHSKGKSGTAGVLQYLSALATLAGILMLGCGSSDVEPVDIYPEDMCAHCRMAFSDHRFAAEIITEQGQAFKFDDIGCMEVFQTDHKEVKIAAHFYKDFYTKSWIAKATVVETAVMTPMSSGKVAFADREKAEEFARQYPATSRVR